MPEPLTEEERLQVERLLGSPLFFPDDFKTWVQEQMQMQQVKNTSSGLLSTLPAGLVFACAGATVPPGTLLCDGTSYLRSSYKRLVDVIGITYGGDATNFNVPDYRGRVLVGAGGALSLGATDGDAFASRGPHHHHHLVETASVEVWGDTDGSGDHTHAQGLNMVKAINGADSDLIYVVQAGSGINPYGATSSGGGDHSHGVYASGSAVVDTDTSGGGSMDAPSFAVVNHVINY